MTITNTTLPSGAQAGDLSSEEELAPLPRSTHPGPIEHSMRRPYRPATPIAVSDPGYPINSLSEGAVVLELRISELGAIEVVRVVSAPRDWQILP